MGRSEYRNVQIPADLADQIDAYVDDNELGYRNRAEVVHAAIREFLERRSVDKHAESVLDKVEREMMEVLRNQRGRE